MKRNEFSRRNLHITDLNLNRKLVLDISLQINIAREKANEIDMSIGKRKQLMMFYTILV